MIIQIQLNENRNLICKPDKEDNPKLIESYFVPTPEKLPSSCSSEVNRVLWEIGILFHTVQSIRSLSCIFRQSLLPILLKWSRVNSFQKWKFEPKHSKQRASRDQTRSQGNEEKWVWVFRDLEGFGGGTIDEFEWIKLKLHSIKFSSFCFFSITFHQKSIPNSFDPFQKRFFASSFWIFNFIQ